MGCDIHTYVERQSAGSSWERIEGEPFEDRSYAVFAFLAGVRNYSEVTPISKPRGLPEGVSDYVMSEWVDWASDGHSRSWLSVEELAAFDYDAEFTETSADADVGSRRTTFREFLGLQFFVDLAVLRDAETHGPTRVVFWFDN